MFKVTWQMRKSTEKFTWILTLGCSKPGFKWLYEYE